MFDFLTFKGHLPDRFWLRVALHGLAWSGVAVLPLVVAALLAPVPLTGFAYWVLVVPTVLMAGFYYLNSLVLLPRFLARRQAGRYFGSVGLAGGLISGIIMLLRSLLERHALLPPPDALHPPAAALLVSFGGVWALSSWQRITGEWFAAERRRQALATDHLVAELALLKSQVSPHVLFNTLNNIYSLAHLKSDDVPAAILQLSHLLRYMLYEADAPRVALAREVEYLENYLDLQRLQVDEHLFLTFEVEGDCAGQLIEPMLLIPFVENAFKHGLSHEQPSPIAIRLRVTDDELRLQVRNRWFAGAARPAPAPGGLGLPNIERRLALLYPGRHRLQAGQEGDFFTVELQLQLTAVPAPTAPSPRPFTASV
ncbi:sensor histidine kinase [Hymenobacter terricola]|uniref:sensor histidine kinase n=1 Tax=Hymenobacter terricola TaxID=2819236 RepID=UPI001B314078|nr:sensor histidine kinase [Hymenobacter terricola]